MPTNLEAHNGDQQEAGQQRPRPPRGLVIGRYVFAGLLLLTMIAKTTGMAFAHAPRGEWLVIIFAVCFFGFSIAGLIASNR